jgi:hypothetical protein
LFLYCFTISYGRNSGGFIKGESKLIVADYGKIVVKSKKEKYHVFNFAKL